DVKASFDHIIFPPPGILSPRKSVFDAVQKVGVVDPLTVQFTLSAPRSFFIAAIASGWNVIYRKKTLEENHFDLKKVKVAPGTGPLLLPCHPAGRGMEDQKPPPLPHPGVPLPGGPEDPPPPFCPRHCRCPPDRPGGLRLRPRGRHPSRRPEAAR